MFPRYYLYMSLLEKSSCIITSSINRNFLKYDQNQKLIWLVGHHLQVTLMMCETCLLVTFSSMYIKIPLPEEINTYQYKNKTKENSIYNDERFLKTLFLSQSQGHLNGHFRQKLNIDFFDHFSCLIHSICKKVKSINRFIYSNMYASIIIIGQERRITTREMSKFYNLQVMSRL